MQYVHLIFLKMCILWLLAILICVEVKTSPLALLRPTIGLRGVLPPKMFFSRAAQLCIRCPRPNLVEAEASGAVGALRISGNDAKEKAWETPACC
jgi:hypothetical protein